MSRRTEARGATFQEALTTAISDLLDVAPDEVELQLRAPRATELGGRIRIELEVEQAQGADVVPEGDAADREADTDGEEETDGGEETDGEEDASREADDGDAGRSEDGEREPIRPEDLDEEADVAADFLEGLLDAMELPGDLRIRVHEDHAEVEVIDIGSGALIGRRGQTLEAIQELVRCALQREFQRRSRVKVDAEGYRSRRLEKLLEKAQEAIDDVLDGAEPERLEPMDVFERKAVHQLVASFDGVASRSQGREPARRVIIERD